MKILIPGREGQTEPAAPFECTGNGNGNGGCGASLLVQETDLFQTKSHARDETSYYTTFQCPQCNTWTDVKTKLKARSPARPCYTHHRIDCGCKDGGPR